jgi:hypothetical protein
MNNPILIAVDKDEQSLQFVEQELRKRYGADYEVICGTGDVAGAQG